MLAGVLLLALVVARSCASPDQISQAEAIEIAKTQVPYEPDRTQVRFVRRGVPKSRGYWAVSLSTVDSSGRLDQVTVVVVDARTRAVTEVRKGNP